MMSFQLNELFSLNFLKNNLWKALFNHYLLKLCILSYRVYIVTLWSWKKWRYFGLHLSFGVNIRLIERVGNSLWLITRLLDMIENLLYYIKMSWSIIKLLLFFSCLQYLWLLSRSTKILGADTRMIYFHINLTT